MELEEEFEITIPDEEAEKIKTVGQAIDYIEDKLKEKGRRRGSAPPRTASCRHSPNSRVSESRRPGFVLLISSPPRSSSRNDATRRHHRHGRGYPAWLPI